MGDCDSAINDWLNACSHAPRLPASSTTHHEMCERYDEDETCVLLCCPPDKMPNRFEDPDVEHPKRGQPKARLAHPSRKQPPRASSSGSQQHSSQSGQTRHIEAFSLSRTPSLPPPANDPEMDFVASTAELNLNSSSLARSEAAISTRPTSVSHYQGGRDGSVRSSEMDGSLAGKRMRSRSPIKKVVDLSAARPPIRYDPSEVPREVEIILERFKGVFKGRRLMPLSLKVRQRLYLSCLSR